MRDKKVLHSWGVWSLVEATVASANGELFERTFVDTPGAVGAVAVTADGDVVMVWQYRAPLDAMNLEIPAGMCDIEGEDNLLTAQRELAEEVGFIAKKWDYLGTCVSAAGMTNSMVSLFLARDLSEVELDRHGPEEREMQTSLIALDDALQMVEDGLITDAKSVMGLMLAHRRMTRGQ
ncbi:MAG: NUDIX hydrolase [Ilumatobacteraceae bacterium]|nr:NUDIX hydrolase [Ilumatobacteraceae bacterium]